MSNKCPQCGSKEIKENKETLSGLEVYELYCFKCNYSTEEWGGIAMWKAYELANDLEAFDSKVVGWKRLKPYNVLLKFRVLLVEEKGKQRPDFYRHSIYILAKSSSFSTTEKLQSILQNYLSEADFVSDVPIEQLGNVREQYFLEFRMEDLLSYLPPSEHEKASAVHYLSLNQDSIEVLTEEQLIRSFPKPAK